ncbi:MAG: hypothetical protein R3A80_13405 [Bdellovibrionota bacterium]
MFKQKWSLNFIKIIAFCAVLAPTLSIACPEGSYTERTIDRNYSSRISPVAFPVARHLGLNESCYGRRLYKIQMWASTSAGAGLATLLVNGRPVGITQKLDSEVKLYEFPLDLDYNFMGMHLNMASMEIRLAGDFYVSKVSAVLNTDEDVEVSEDPWSDYGIILGQSQDFVQELTQSTLEIKKEDNPLSMLVFVARKADISIQTIRVYWADGTHQNYGPVVIPSGEARRIDNNDTKEISRVLIKAKAAADNDDDSSSGYLEMRGIQAE